MEILQTSRLGRRQKALVYRFLKPHRVHFIPQLEPDVKSGTCFFKFYVWLAFYSKITHLLKFDFMLHLGNFWFLSEILNFVFRFLLYFWSFKLLKGVKGHYVD